ncbi:hypothetical protein COCNU_02G010900 [Cocos nucifera]|uniref:Catabolite repression protein creC n=1 Tax=Cocos nucifera TaxID=13894 RepID=A0A8K0I088_COCNU|nr:hypothetical protein COCNU_02G010900 [Cocos nucifera]
MATSSSSINAQSPGLKTYFKTPEGRYKLQYEKTHPAAVLHYSHGKAVSQLTIAYLKEKAANQAPSTPSTPSSGGGVRSAAARLLGAGNGSRALSFVGGNGVSRVVSGNSRTGGSLGSSIGSSSSQSTSNYDGKGAYLIFNAADTLFISDLNSQDKDPIKSIHFSNSNPVCHAFDAEAKDGHDLLIGLHTGDGLQTCFIGKGLFNIRWLAYFLASKVSGVAFDSYWSAPNSDGTGENVMYRFGSVGQDTQLLLWDLVMDEIVVPFRSCPPGGSPTLSGGSHSAHWDDICPIGTLQPSPSMRDVPKLSPLVAHRAHVEPLSGLIFTNESVLTICREGHIKIWVRPGNGESSQSNSSEAVAGSASLKDRPVTLSLKSATSSYKQPSAVLFT